MAPARALACAATAVAAILLVACASGQPSQANGGKEELQMVEGYAASGYDAGVIPEELERIPDGYRQPAGHAGTLEPLEYGTYDSFNYDIEGHGLQKTAWVYVPYGYDASRQYDVLYLSHGGWSDETTLMGTDERPTAFKHAVDHAIEDGLMRPLIMVMPTYNNLSPDDSGDYSLALRLTDGFHNELAGDLIPAVESRYSTHAGGDVTPEGLRASRDHRAFAGFSMGGVNTWHAFQYCLPYFRWFNPMSGGGLPGAGAAQLARAQGYGERDFFIFTATGTDDFAYSGFKAGVLAMPGDSGGFFELADSPDAGNLSYREREGYTHGPQAADEYTYNAMRFLFNGTCDLMGADGGEGQAQAPAPALFEPYTADTPIADVANDPALGDWGRLLFPADAGYTGGSTLGNMSLTWYGAMDPAMTVDICNYAKGRAAAEDAFFIDIYTPDEKAADPRKADTGLFFFRGDEDAPTAIVNAGGGFAFVGAMHDSFPHCMELSRRGYNAFALIYRPGASTACEDLAHAIAYLYEHATELCISMEGYSLWGGSAGARMAAWLGARGTASVGEAAYPRPAAC
ncbi:MAG: hypothetical protein IJ087_11185, partial [Eggerthellaceae bacterium]|nr:hypothetical protein [Eggerthellaceae bacterium]